jgi:hypothetical protein
MFERAGEKQSLGVECGRANRIPAIVGEQVDSESLSRYIKKDKRLSKLAMNLRCCQGGNSSSPDSGAERSVRKRLRKSFDRAATHPDRR